ncbi:hypothetical protein C2E21_0415 [Chlorella sorokiniana]|uniref:Uncharacterized protein n=1 Tax=Chlorella sorokiniana TaxID=3076 RepID=A0A2P6U3K4_CHLSO|nr:hypothetical protein C2E21_0415 [Chlorella sorokiniana]|eukprot:PRW60897.1 hypothetical protein C2E21_0415 [Chlorella sorokiniana]
MVKLFVSQHERCRLRVTISAEPGENPDPRGEHKVTLAAVMVTHIEDMEQAGTLSNIKWVSSGVKMG